MYRTYFPWEFIRVQSGTTLTKIVWKEHDKQICFSYNFRKCLQKKANCCPQKTLLKGNQKKNKKCCEIVFWKKKHGLWKICRPSIKWSTVSFYKYLDWRKANEEKYLNHGRSKMQGMYLKFPIFLIIFDIIKEKELHQSIKTAKGRVNKREGWCGTLSKHLILSSINWNSLRVTKQNQNGYTTRLDNMIEMTKGTLSVANDPNTVEICQENPRWKLGEGGGAVWCIEW